MSNSLAVLAYTDEPELNDVQKKFFEESQKEQNAFDIVLPRFKIPTGGGLKFTSDTGDDVKEFTGIIVISQKARAYWPNNALNKNRPLCSSVDGIYGVFREDVTNSEFEDASKAHKPHPAIPLLTHKKTSSGIFECAKCPLSKFGSAHQGNSQRGQGCKDLRRLVVVVDGMSMPVLITLPPTSGGVFDEYASNLSARRLVYFGVRTKITLAKEQSRDGIPYSRTEFMPIGQIENMEQAEAIDHIRDQYRQYIDTMPIDNEDYNTESGHKNGHNENVIVL